MIPGVLCPGEDLEVHTLRRPPMTTTLMEFSMTMRGLWRQNFKGQDSRSTALSALEWSRIVLRMTAAVARITARGEMGWEADLRAKSAMTRRRGPEFQSVTSTTSCAVESRDAHECSRDTIPPVDEPYPGGAESKRCFERSGKDLPEHPKNFQDFHRNALCLCPARSMGLWNIRVIIL